MNKIIATGLISVFFFSSSYYGSTTAPVILAGAVIKSKHKDEVVVKYKRKDCPVCKGKGWYMSGDDIKKIDCTYCEPENKTNLIPAPSAPSKNCTDDKCSVPRSSYRVIK